MKTGLAEKLVLGTVQFGTLYGVSNTLGVPNDEELARILDIASGNGINILDSAPAYGNAQQRLSQYAAKRFEVVSKFSNVRSRESLNTTLLQTLQDLGISKLYALISHNSEELIANPELWDFLSDAKEKIQTEKIGFSLYSPEQLEKLWELGMKPDLVQLPYNLLDRKFQPYLLELKKQDCEIHVRSVFLQGLFFLDLNHLSAKLETLRPAISLIQDLCVQYGITVSELSLYFVKNNPLIDKIIIGVASADQLIKNIDEFSLNRVAHTVIEQILNIQVPDRKILNPVNWL
jgi:aryl-alcohol dehydrogenase-like predicted oxidoreductase